MPFNGHKRLHDGRMALRGREAEAKEKGTRMEQITKRNGIYYYGESKCVDADDAYRRFRADYHASIGRSAFLRLDRLGQRMERVHGFGFEFLHRVLPPVGCGGKTRCRFLGLVHLSYCRLVGLWDYSDIPEEKFDEWFDWAFSRGSGALRTLGKNRKVGRTSKTLKKRYR